MVVVDLLISENNSGPALFSINISRHSLQSLLRDVCRLPFCPFISIPANLAQILAALWNSPKAASVCQPGIVFGPFIPFYLYTSYFHFLFSVCSVVSFIMGNTAPTLNFILHRSIEYGLIGQKHTLVLYTFY